MLSPQVPHQPTPSLYATDLHRIARARDEARDRARLARQKGHRIAARQWASIADQADDQLAAREDEAIRSYLHLSPRGAA